MPISNRAMGFGLSKTCSEKPHKAALPSRKAASLRFPGVLDGALLLRMTSDASKDDFPLENFVPARQTPCRPNRAWPRSMSMRPARGRPISTAAPTPTPSGTFIIRPAPSRRAGAPPGTDTKREARKQRRHALGRSNILRAIGKRIGEARRATRDSQEAPRMPD